MLLHYTAFLQYCIIPRHPSILKYGTTHFFTCPLDIQINQIISLNSLTKENYKIQTTSGLISKITKHHN